MKKVLFHTNQLSLRGTEVALFDYAYYNQALFGNISIIATPRVATHDAAVIQKFQEHFEVVFYTDITELNQIASQKQADVFYALKAGKNDGVMVKGVKNCIHAVFRFYEPHGDVYAYVSQWLSHEMSAGKSPYVPHMINLPEENGNLREELGIPAEAIVFGRYGGMDTFDLKFVKRAVYNIAARHPDKYFLFMNTDNFIQQKDYYKSGWKNKLLGSIFYSQNEFRNIIFLEGNADSVYKVKFINTCDAMLHARTQGESFGIACGEFSIKGKPVITCDADFVPERSHIDILGKDGFYYRNYGDIIQLLSRFNRHLIKDSPYSREFNPVTVMQKFKQVFLDD